MNIEKRHTPEDLIWLINNPKTTEDFNRDAARILKSIEFQDKRENQRTIFRFSFPEKKPTYLDKEPITEQNIYKAYVEHGGNDVLLDRNVVPRISTPSIQLARVVVSQTYGFDAMVFTSPYQGVNLAWNEGVFVPIDRKPFIHSWTIPSL